jgi:hypothetical protein
MSIPRVNNRQRSRPICRPNAMQALARIEREIDALIEHAPAQASKMRPAVAKLGLRNLLTAIKGLYL